MKKGKGFSSALLFLLPIENLKVKHYYNIDANI